MIQSVNIVVRSLLFQASMSPSYWVESLHTATHPPTKKLSSSTQHMALFGAPPTYDHLQVFGCTCYPNLSATAPHKLAPRSTLCVFLGYSAHHKGYRCLDLSSNRVVVSRHVVLDETSFPFSQQLSPLANADFDFLLEPLDVVPAPIGLVPPLLPVGSSPGAPPAPPAPSGGVSAAPVASAQPRVVVSPGVPALPRAAVPSPDAPGDPA